MLQRRSYKKARKGGFKTFRELCAAVRGGFSGISELYDAMDIKAPDAETLRAYSLVKELMVLNDLSDLSEGLVVALVAVRMSGKAVAGLEERSVSLDEIWLDFSEIVHGKAKNIFNRFQSEADIERFLEGSKGRFLGNYSQTNREIYFSMARIYIDGANLAFMGAKRGERRKSLERPDYSLLEKCVCKIRELSLGDSKIIFDGLVGKKLERTGTEADKRIYFNLKDQGKLEITVLGEKADDVIIQKLRDDPHAFAIANDNYAKDHNFTDRDRSHQINFRFDGSSFEFYGEGFETLTRLHEMFLRAIETRTDLRSLSRLGQWPYSGKLRDPEMYVLSCCGKNNSQ